MNDIEKSQILKAAELAKIILSDEEKSEFSKQLTDIINHVEKINEMDTEDILPTDHIVDLKNVVRKDIVHESIDISEIRRIAPEFKDGHVIVPRIIEE